MKNCTFILIILAHFLYCGSSAYQVRSQAQLQKGRVILASTKAKKNRVDLFEKERMGEIDADKSALQSLLFQLNQNNVQIDNILILNDDSLAVVSYTDGIYILPIELIDSSRVNTEHDATSSTEDNETETTSNEMEVVEPDIIRLAESNQQLRSNQVFDLYVRQEKGKKFFYVTYNAAQAYGVSKCPYLFGQEITCTAIDKTNSELKSDYVVEVAADIKGNLWFRYDPSEEVGVSRLNSEGSFDHFTQYNSELGDSSVEIMSIEAKGQGLKEDNIWFVTGSGLSRLQYKDEKELWRLYGKKKNFGTTVAKIIGIEDWFSNVILDITHLEVLADSLLIANAKGLYHFTESDINKFIPEDLGGLDKNSIGQIFVRENYIAVELNTQQTGKKELSFFLSLDLKKRKWRKVNLWSLRKIRPKSIELIPYDEKFDLLTLRFHHDADALVLYDFKEAKVYKVIKNTRK